MSYAYKIIDSPAGALKLVSSENGLAAILFRDDDQSLAPLTPLVDRPNDPILLETERQLGQYFEGTRKEFSVPLDFHGTDFQRSVWEALLTIPFGETRSYGEIARQVGKPSASRAVGAANGRNPISIIAPCHRVIGSSGELTGYGGGLDVKEMLLSLEARGSGRNVDHSVQLAFDVSSNRVSTIE
jgi:methylated-DNA-[protein]-cysteine S-methyltransferase